MLKADSTLIGLLDPFNAAGLEAIAKTGVNGLRHGVAAAHDLARPGDGRAVVAGEHRRLQGSGSRGCGVRQVLPDADDGRGHGQGGARAGARRGRGRPAGDRDRQAPRRGDRGDRRAARGQGADRVAGRQVRRRALPHRRGARDRRGQGRLRAPDAARLDAPAGGGRAPEGAAVGHRHHHRADPRPARAGADQGRNGAGR